MEFRIETDNVKILQSGSVITYNNQPIDFIIESLEYKFKFIDDKNKDVTFEAENVVGDKKKAIINFYNYNSPLGIGSTSPIEIGHLNKKQLYMSFRIYALKEGLDKLIHYTFYVEN